MATKSGLLLGPWTGIAGTSTGTSCVSATLSTYLRKTGERAAVGNGSMASSPATGIGVSQRPASFWARFSSSIFAGYPAKIEELKRAQKDAGRWETPIPVAGDDAIEPFPTAALSPVFRRYVESVAETQEVPVDVPAIPVHGPSNKPDFVAIGGAPG